MKWIRHRIEEFLERAEDIRKQYSKIDSNETISPEKLLYEHALKLVLLIRISLKLFSQKKLYVKNVLIISKIV